ncbi:molybdopterin-guanine dinucleotide biosynthesis protein B [Salidesulfovibrio brasiliensis]|uniref:molybdopterin-guanine dinucleotide biosynthesis protein B n=1 Tax=Salidesulfovibrio brasiliensis TaxID=221711 RepID=UPI0006D167A1|nr:molybdopterin-guanine dinucleotide biosynthesis protein B [Salidesulfovibrio brasiliensis]
MSKPVVCIVGKKKSGKTTFIEKLIPALRARGIRVGTVKHDTHGFEVDREGKDTWRHREAGAQTVVISSPQRLAVIKEMEREMELGEIADTFFADRDLVLTEGYFRSSMPKVEVFRPEAHAQPLCGPDDAWERNLLAFVTDSAVDPGVPVFGLEDADGLAAFIEDWLGL